MGHWNYHLMYPHFGYPPLGPMSTESLRNAAQEEIPFLVEPFTSYRAWTIDIESRKEPFLRSITYRIGWPKRRPFRSHCMTQWYKTHRDSPSPRAYSHSAPDMEHRCGVYSLLDEKDCSKWQMGRVNVIFGSVKVWGKVFKYEKGFLSEFAYPYEIIGIGDRWAEDPEKLVYKISESYGMAIKL